MCSEAHRWVLQNEGSRATAHTGKRCSLAEGRSASWWILISSVYRMAATPPGRAGASVSLKVGSGGQRTGQVGLKQAIPPYAPWIGERIAKIVRPHSGAAPERNKPVVRSHGHGAGFGTNRPTRGRNRQTWDLGQSAEGNRCEVTAALFLSAGASRPLLHLFGSTLSQLLLPG